MTHVYVIYHDNADERRRVACDSSEQAMALGAILFRCEPDHRAIPVQHDERK